MDRESLILLEEIDTNCNSCKCFTRDVEWAKKQRDKNIQYGLSKRLSHAKGFCSHKQEIVKTPNGSCTPNNSDCWKSRRE